MPAPDRRPEAPLLLLGLAVTVGLLSASASWSLGVDGAWFGAAEGAIVAGLLVAVAVAAFAVATGRVALRIWLAALMALAPSLHYLAELGGYGLSYSLWESDRIAVLAVTGCTVGAVGLVLRKSWARWLALAAALGGIGTSGLNIFGTLAAPNVMTWVYALSISFSAIVGLALVGPRVRAQFETEGADGVWSSSDPAVRSIRWTVLSQLVAIPMLLVYAWVQPIVPQTRGLALVLAAILTVGALLCMGRKVLGAIVMSLGGPALLVLAGLTAWLAYTQGAPQHLNIAGYYACFWAPAGVISTIAGVALARPIWRMWRSL